VSVVRQAGRGGAMENKVLKRSGCAWHEFYSSNWPKVYTDTIQAHTACS